MHNSDAYTIQRYHMFAIDALLLVWFLTPSVFIPNTDLKDGSCSFVLSYVSSTGLLFAQCYAQVMKKKKRKKKKKKKKKSKT